MAPMGGALGRCLSDEGGALMSGSSALTRGWGGMALSSYDSEEVPAVNLEVPSPGGQAGALHLGPLNTFLFRSHTAAARIDQDTWETNTGSFQ